MASVAPFGTWSSEITADQVAENTSRLEDVVVDGITHVVYHIETRPHEEGRSAIVDSRQDIDLIQAPWDARTQAQEFGGGAVFAYNDRLIFSDYTSRRVHMTCAGMSPVPITPDSPVYRYAGFVAYPPQPEYLIAVREDHSSGITASTETALVILDCTLISAGNTFLSGIDFLSSPRFSPDGSRLAWLQWSHPHMPWDSAELFVSRTEFSAGELTLQDPIKVYGGLGKISVSQPRWLDNNHLVFLEDSSGFHNPRLLEFSDSYTSRLLPLLSEPLNEEFCLPEWYFGQSNYAILTSTSILFSTLANGRSRLYLARIPCGARESTTFTDIDSPFVEVRSLHSVASDEVIFIGRTDTEAEAIISLKLSSSGTRFEVLKSSSQAPVADSISTAVPIQLHFPNDSGRPLYLFFYSPVNPQYQGPDNERPPAIFNLHGGPTFRQSAGFDWERQFFTSRGWAWIDINYTGSSGHGRKYRELLNGKWGIIDVEDCFEAVTHLRAQSLIDDRNVAIRGPSAGGFTTLSTLIAHPDTFAAATSIYGGVDMLRLQLSGSVHKFTSHYYEALMGGNVQENPGLFKKRSPLSQADRIKTPLLVLQGLLDAVVPVTHAESLVQTIKASGKQVEYRVFADEGHGWRKQDGPWRANGGNRWPRNKAALLTWDLTGGNTNQLGNSQALYHESGDNLSASSMQTVSFVTQRQLICAFDAHAHSWPSRPLFQSSFGLQDSNLRSTS